MKRLERILRALFWLPILLGGTVAFSYVEPSFHKFGVISVALLIVFVVLLLAALERRALARSRNEQTDVARSREVVCPGHSAFR